MGDEIGPRIVEQGHYLQLFCIICVCFPLFDHFHCIVIESFKVIRSVRDHVSMDVQ